MAGLISPKKTSLRMGAIPGYAPGTPDVPTLPNPASQVAQGVTSPAAYLPTTAPLLPAAISAIPADFAANNPFAGTAARGYAAATEGARTGDIGRQIGGSLTGVAASIPAGAFALGRGVMSAVAPVARSFWGGLTGIPSAAPAAPATSAAPVTPVASASPWGTSPKLAAVMTNLGQIPAGYTPGAAINEKGERPFDIIRRGEVTHYNDLNTSATPAGAPSSHMMSLRALVALGPLLQARMQALSNPQTQMQGKLMQIIEQQHLNAIAKRDPKADDNYKEAILQAINAPYAAQLGLAEWYQKLGQGGNQTQGFVEPADQ
jgi:hypothetical protein